MSIWSRARQWLYPAAFRFDPPDQGSAAALLLMRMVEVAESGPSAGAGDSPTRAERPTKATPPPPPSGLGDPFVIDLCNQFHRVRQSAARIPAGSGEDGDRFRLYLGRLDQTLEAHHIRCQDLSGQRFDEGRLDFEPLGPPVSTEGLQWMTIVQCDRPAIFLAGKLIQRAKGVVGRPAEN